MNISPLPIKLVRQQPQSSDCVRCCGLMAFNYFNDEINKDELWKKLHVYKKHSGLFGSYLTDLGILAIKQGYHATYYSYDTSWWDKTVIEAAKSGQKALYKALKALKANKKSWHEKKEVQKELDFLKKGGKIQVTIPQLQTIDSYLQKRIPAILVVRAENLYQEPSETNPHAILVTGKQNQDYLIRDPYLGLDKVNEQELLYAWMRDGGGMLVLVPDPEKKKAVEKPKVIQQKLRIT